MDKEWRAPHELMGVAGLPTSRQGVNKRAHAEGWERRKREGGRGRAVEYAVDSLPPAVRHGLQMKEAPSPAYGGNTSATRLSSWIQIFHQLSSREQDALIEFVLREGAVAMLSRLDIARDTPAGSIARKD